MLLDQNILGPVYWYWLNMYVMEKVYRWVNW